MSEYPQSNVRNLVGKGDTGEDILRDCLSEFAEMRSRGQEPRVVVLYLSDHCQPGMRRNSMTLNDLAACEKILSVVVARDFALSMNSDTE